MLEEIELPKKKLSEDAVKVWWICEVIENVIAFIILAVLFYLDYRFSWKEWVGWILIGLAALFVPGLVWSAIEPKWKWKGWRYDVSEEFLMLKQGVWKEQQQLIPMTKIQSVATEQGPILRKYGLYTVKVETMASLHTIPALPRNVAFGLRNEIAQYAKIKEVEG
ncbi:PH domain-containing protein [Bacillus massilinigeriensis]|uniref:PH domain-containing protein n=1 Tax=Bacillus mediterraneensis TaxID=1805474 RepID=UPI0008F939F3|nr:PH domain-containing protein [Bacillus mediterraneensis]